MTFLFKGLVASVALVGCSLTAHAETLRLLTWGGYAREAVIEAFEDKYPDIKGEVTVSNSEEMVAKLRATDGADFDLAQPSVSRVLAAQSEYGIYKPLDLSKIDTSVFQPNMMKAMEENAKIGDDIYSVPHVWGTQGLIVDISKAPDVNRWGDLCDPQYKGRVSMRLKRALLLGMAFDMGKDPFAAYNDPAAYQAILDEVEAKLIACKENVKTFWTGGTDLSNLILSGEIVLSDAWDSTAFKLFSDNQNIRFVPTRTGALAWIDTFALPAKGEADDATVALVAREAAGSMRDALTLLDQIVAFGGDRLEGEEVARHLGIAARRCRRPAMPRWRRHRETSGCRRYRPGPGRRARRGGSRRSAP